MLRKIYVASSWKNPYLDTVFSALTEDGHNVYDFREPNAAFTWDELDPNFKNWNPLEFIGALELDKSCKAFHNDAQALNWCNTCVLVLPCGKSAHLEAGFAIGAGKFLHILLEEGEPVQAELMYKLAHGIYPNLQLLRETLK